MQKYCVGYFEREVNVMAAITDYGYIKATWDALSGLIPNEIGRAGLLGNWYAESKVIPYIKQGNTRPPWSPSTTYTNNVDNGTISKSTFVNDSIGYGFAQWTYWSRKELMYTIANNLNMSIGAFDVGIAMVTTEMTQGSQEYKDTLTILQNATDIRTASDRVLHNYEKPADQSENAEIIRADYGNQIYDLMHGTAPIERKSLTISPNSVSIVDGETVTINVDASGDWSYNLGQYLSLIEKTDGALVVSGNANAAQITTAIAFWLTDDTSIQTQCQIGINIPAPPAPSISVTPYSQTANVNTIVRFMVSANRAWSVKIPNGASLYRKDGNSVYIKIANTALRRIVLRFYIDDDVNIYQDVTINILGVSPVPSGRKMPFIYYSKPFLKKVR